MKDWFDSTGSNCPICLRKDTTFKEIDEQDYKARWIFQVSCPGCGKFEVNNGRFSNSLELSENERIQLCGIIRRYNDEVGRPYPLAALNEYKVNILSANFPNDVIDRIEILLTYAAKKAPHFGLYTTSEGEQSWRARLFLPKESSLQTLLKVVENAGLIHVRTPQTGDISLTLIGWEKLREIKLRKSVDSSQAFVAMWFHEDLNEVYTNGIYPALKETGLDPFRVDKNPNENRIDHEIMSQIRKSKFLIADVTGERAGVYYEAGFAQGLGIPVIWTCNSSWKTKIIENVYPNSIEEPLVSEFTWPRRMHFDTRQFPHIFWRDSTDFKSQLISNIVGRGLDSKNK
jgi:hypothetical protein